jgi:putative transposase
MGLNNITLSDKSKIQIPKEIIKYEKKLNRFHRNISRKKLGSSNRNKARVKLSKLYDKINNRKYDFLHKLSSKIIHENQVIVLEDLSINKMNKTKQKNINKAYNNLSWSIFKSMLKYKANWYGRTLILAPKYYPSSKLCSICNYKNEDIKNLNIKEWYCPQCGTHHDRDINAAINLKKIGQELSKFTPVEIGSVDERSLVNLKSTLSMKQEALTSIS